MMTHIDIDAELVAQAMKVSGARTKREVVDRALREMVARSRRVRFLDIWGSVPEDALWPDYDPKGLGGSNRVEEGVIVPEATSTPKAEPPAKRRRKT